MPAAPPRLRQLRRDKLIFSLVRDVARLDLEEAERLGRHPALEQHPDSDLDQLRRMLRYWQGVSIIRVSRQYRCSIEVAAGLVHELRDELADTLSPDELRATPLSELLDVPTNLLPEFLRPPAA